MSVGGHEYSSTIDNAFDDIVCSLTIRHGLGQRGEAKKINLVSVFVYRPSRVLYTS